MENSKFQWSKRPWLYFLFNWGSPVYVTEHLFGCVEYARRLSEKWGNPIPEGLSLARVTALAVILESISTRLI